MSYNNNNIVDGYALGPLGSGCPCDGSAVNAKFITSMALVTDRQRADYLRNMSMRSMQAKQQRAMNVSRALDSNCYIPTGDQIGVL
jgi:hypothetical protein